MFTLERSYCVNERCEANWNERPRISKADTESPNYWGYDHSTVYIQ